MSNISGATVEAIFAQADGDKAASARGVTSGVA